MKKRSFQKNDTGTIENIHTCTHTHIDPLLSLYRKNNKKWFTDLNVKSKTIKLLLENMGESVDSWPRQRFFWILFQKDNS